MCRHQWSRPRRNMDTGVDERSCVKCGREERNPVQYGKVDTVALGELTRSRNPDILFNNRPLPEEVPA
jgi:hypothetical protein